MASARDCARLLLEIMPALRRGLGGLRRQQESADDEPLTMDQARRLKIFKILGHEPHTLGELAARQGVTPSTMSRSVDALVRAGLVSRISDPSDRRQVILELTDAGRTAQARMVKHAEDMFTAQIEELTDAQRERLFDGLDVLRTLLERMGSDVPDQPEARRPS
jgi:DNA-binding MarR family transcriptional regulator